MRSGGQECPPHASLSPNRSGGQTFLSASTDSGPKCNRPRYDDGAGRLPAARPRYCPPGPAGRGAVPSTTASPPGRKRTRRDGAIRPLFSDNTVVGHTRIDRVVDRRIVLWRDLILLQGEPRAGDSGFTHTRVKKARRKPVRIARG
jgi:hypothetical protein